MKSVITRVSTALALCAFASIAFAQSPAPTDSVTPADVLPAVQTSDLPSKVFIAGAGIHAGQPTGFVNLLLHTAGPVYAAFAEDTTAGKTSTRVGIETIVFRKAGFFFTLKGAAGVATGATATGGSYGVGGSVLFDLAKIKLPGAVAAFSGTWDYSNIADLASNASNGQIRAVLSGGAYRFGIGKTF